MSRISGHNSRAAGGFTLVEVMVAMSVSLIVLGGVLGAYVFLGRNLARMVNIQQQQVQSRHALRQFTQDLSTAKALTSASASALTLTKPVATGTATVAYAYNAATGKLSRQETSPAGTTTTATILSNLTSFSFNFYNSGGTAVSTTSPSVKAVEFSFVSAVGNSNSSTLTAYNSVSPRIVLRNKAVLQ